MALDLTQFVPHGLVGAVAAVIGWVGKQHISADRRNNEKLDGRITAVESGVRSDLAALRARLDEVADQSYKGQCQILTVLAEQRPPRQ